MRSDDGISGWQILSHQWNHILIYLLSFVLVGVYSVTHHNMMHFVTGINRTLLWLNLMLLLFIVFIRFAAGQLSASHADPSSIHVATFICSISAALRRWLTPVQIILVVSPAPLPSRLSAFMWACTFLVRFYSLAIALASWCPLASMVSMTLVPAFFVMPNPWMRGACATPWKDSREHEKKEPLE